MSQAKVFILFLLFAYLCSTGVRLHQFVSILSNPAYNSGDVILTTHDGYRWLRFASDYIQGRYAGGADRLAGLPENIQTPPEFPMISYFTAELADIFGLSLENAGGLLSVFLPGLFVFPLGLFFYLTGFRTAGIGAVFLGGLSLAYLSRTSAFQIDTDMLSLFFISTGAMLCLLAGRGRTLLWSGLLGVNMYLFWRWYFHSGFTVIYLFILIFALRRRRVKDMAMAAGVYILFASPFVFFNGFSALNQFINPETVRYVHADVAELHTVELAKVFMSVSPYWLLAMLGLLASLLLGRYVVYLAVFYLLSFFAFTRGVRFEMFLAPLCGCGLGLFFDLISKGRAGAVAYALTSSMTILFMVKPFLAEIPPPVTDAQTYEAIKKLNETEPDAVVASLWDNGFMVEYLAERGVFADGASQFKRGAEIYAKALFNPDSKKAAAELAEASGGRPVYLLFTPDMDMKLPAIIKTAGYRAEITEINNADGITFTKIDPRRGSERINLTDTMYFRLHVIGGTDIPCFRKIYSNNHFSSVYRLLDECR